MSEKLRSKLPLVELNQKESSALGPVNENILRPKSLKEYIGQKAAASQLEVFMRAAKHRGQALDHVLLSGPPGLGKTTLAHIVAQEMGGRLHQAPGPTLEKNADLLSILSELKAGDILFIDEIHRLSPMIEESLYPAMEDFQIQIIVGEGQSAQPINLNLEKFTLVGATTQPGKLTAPLRDRFGIQLGLDFYSVDEMIQILKRSSHLLSIALTSEEINAVAKRSRGTPRIANRLLARVRDFVEVVRASKGKTHELPERLQEVFAKNLSPSELVSWALDFLEVDPLGLQVLDRRYMEVLAKQFRGGPAGVEAIAASLSEDRSTLEETIEPYLLKEGLIVRGARGRSLTAKAFVHLGLENLLKLEENPTLL